MRDNGIRCSRIENTCGANKKTPRDLRQEGFVERGQLEGVADAHFEHREDADLA
jgi:hypothetical protein